MAVDAGPCNSLALLQPSGAERREAQDLAPAEGAHGRGQAPRAQLVRAAAAERVPAVDHRNLQPGVHADRAHLWDACQIRLSD